jgi:LacI family transcriptional regulator
MNLKELSVLLGLSPTTVSRALNGYPEVSEATRRKVLQVAASTGYQPNPNAQRLAGGRANTIAVVWTSSRDPDERNSDSALFRTLTEVSSQYELHLMSVPAGSDNGMARIRGLFLTGAVNAALFINPLILPAYAVRPFPTLVYGRRPPAAPGLSWVGVDYRATSLKAARFLLQLGHHHIAVVDNHAKPVEEIIRGLEDARVFWADGASRPLKISRVVNKRFGELWGSSSNCRPTALLCPDVQSANNLVKRGQAEGLIIGKDFSVVAFDFGSPPEYLQRETPVLTSLKLQADAIATQILVALQGILDPGIVGRRPPILLQPELVLGETTGNRPLLEV